MPESPEAVAPTLTLGLRNFDASSPEGGWSRLVERARVADESGVDRIVLVDHVVMGENIDSYEGGTFPTGPDGAWLEPLTVLSLLAGVTTRVRLSTGIIQAGLRRPVVLAKAAATLDVLSGGRLDLGVGVGWQREEYEAAGLDFARRGELLDETLAICRTLWRDSPASYASELHRFDRVWCEPKPVQPGGVPIWVSGRISRRTLDRMLRFGAGWIPWGEYIVDVEPGITALREAFSAAGRDPTGFGVRGMLRLIQHDDGCPDVGRTLDVAAGLVERGVTDLNLVGGLPDDPHELGALLAEVVPAFHQAVGR